MDLEKQKIISSIKNVISTVANSSTAHKKILEDVLLKKCTKFSPKTPKRARTEETSAEPSPKRLNTYESPTMLMRRRSLLQLPSPASPNDDHHTIIKRLNANQKYRRSIISFNMLLKGVVVYVDVKRDNGDNISQAIRTLLNAMGAETVTKLKTGVTHVIFKDGNFKTAQQCNLINAKLVSVLWLETVIRTFCRLPECNFSPFSEEAFDSKIEVFCEKVQRKYQELIKTDRNPETVQQKLMTYFSNSESFNSESVTKTRIAQTEKKVRRKMSTKFLTPSAKVTKPVDLFSSVTLRKDATKETTVPASNISSPASLSFVTVRKNATKETTSTSTSDTSSPTTNFVTSKRTRRKLFNHEDYNPAV